MLQLWMLSVQGHNIYDDWKTFQLHPSRSGLQSVRLDYEQHTLDSSMHNLSAANRLPLPARLTKVVTTRYVNWNMAHDQWRRDSLTLRTTRLHVLGHNTTFNYWGENQSWWCCSNCYRQSLVQDSVENLRVTLLHYGRCRIFDSGGIVNLQTWLSSHYRCLLHWINQVPGGGRSLQVSNRHRRWFYVEKDNDPAAFNC